MAKATLILALLATVAAATPAAAEPRTIVCGPFGYTANGARYAARAITFVIDAAAGAAQYIEADGRAYTAYITDRTDHAIAVTFTTNLVGQEVQHTVTIDNDQQTARLTGLYLDLTFDPGNCRPTARLVW